MVARGIFHLCGYGIFLISMWDPFPDQDPSPGPRLWKLSVAHWAALGILGILVFEGLSNCPY